MKRRKKVDFMDVVTHELNTPITSIKAYTQILRKRCEQNGEDESAAFLRKMDEQIVRLTNIIKTLYR